MFIAIKIIIDSSIQRRLWQLSTMISLSDNDVMCLNKCSHYNKLFQDKHVWNQFNSVPGSCGFCDVLCDFWLEIRESSGAGLTKKFKPHSTVYLFNIASVEKTSKHSPCSNRPVFCRICQQVI